MVGSFFPLHTRNASYYIFFYFKRSSTTSWLILDKLLTSFRESPSPHG